MCNMATVKPVAIVSPMKKPKKSKRKSNKICPGGNLSKMAVNNSVNYDIFNKSCSKSKHFDSSDSSSTSSTSDKVIDDGQSTDAKQNRLCSMFENLNLNIEQNNILDSNVSLNVPHHIPDHDKKILERMAFKLKKELSNVEMAHRARVMWDNERETRERLQKEHEVEYYKYLQAKRHAEREEYERRYEELKEIYDWERTHLRSRISCKDRMAAKRIEDIEERKKRDIHWRRQVADEKARNAMEVIRGHKLAEVVWRDELAQNLEKRILHAVNNKEILLKYCRQRAIIDNRIHEELQKRNWRDQKIMEMERWMMLKWKVEQKRKKINRIQDEKNRIVMQSRKLADSTAKMREHLKRSLSPDTFLRAAVQNQHQHYRSTPQLCMTPNNFESHIRLG